MRYCRGARNSTSTIVIVVLAIFCCWNDQAFSQESETKFCGTVTDVEGNPIADARVYLVPAHNLQGKIGDRTTLKGNNTDKDGNFSMSIEDTKSNWTGLVYKKGFAPALQSIAGSDARGVHDTAITTLEKPLTLKPSKKLTLNFVDSEKNPVNPKSAKLTRFWDGTNVYLKETLENLLAAEVEDNAISIDWLPSGGSATVEIGVGELNYSVSVRNESSTIEVQLPQMTTLVGQVKMNGGQPAPDDFFDDVQLHLRLKHEKANPENTPEYRIRQESVLEVGKDGRFRVDCMAGTGNLRLTKAKVRSSKAVTTKFGNETSVEFELKPQRKVIGKIVDHQGDPVEGVKIEGAVSNMLGEFEVELSESNPWCHRIGTRWLPRTEESPQLTY